MQEDAIYVYNDFSTFFHKKKLFDQLAKLEHYTNSHYFSAGSYQMKTGNKSVIVNTIFKDNKNVSIGDGALIFNCEFKESSLVVGCNTFLNDISWVTLVN